jgi:transposase InsO family protein
MSVERRCGMIEEVHADLSISEQCRLLWISRSSFYYAPQPESDETLTLIRISMDGRGRWMDNVFIERLWRSLKYECVYAESFNGRMRDKLLNEFLFMSLDHARVTIATWAED